MNTPVHRDRMDDPFMDLPPAARPTRSPFDLRLAFNTLTAASHKPFVRLMQEISQRHMYAYNNPGVECNDTKLYGFATAVGLDLLATELVRNWGVKDPDGPQRVHNCISLRSWPDINSNAPQTLQVWLATPKPNVIPFINMPLDGSPILRISSNKHTVMSSDGKSFKPGDWIGDLLVEYARLRVWRERYGDQPRDAPKPHTTLSPHRTGPA